MPLPPETIRVKRKRGDENTPVDFLELEPRAKRHSSASGRWVYQRRGPAQQVHSSPITPVPTPAPAPTSAPRQAPPTKDAAAEKRRFFLSKGTEPKDRKRRREPAVFVERPLKRQRSEEPQTENGGQSSGLDDGSGSVFPRQEEKGAHQASSSDEEQKLKRPSGRRCLPKPPASAQKPSEPTPLPDRVMFDQDYAAFVAEMERWTLKEIGRCQEQRPSASSHAPVATATPNHGGQQTSTSSNSRGVNSKSKVLPAAQRLDSESASIPMPDAPALDPDALAVGQRLGDDGEWVEEVYDRVPAIKLNGGTDNVGLIVFEDEEEQELFYGDDEDDEDVWQDEEDENAENHHTVDYPEEEDGAGDDFIHNPWASRTGESSDEEFDDLPDDEENYFDHLDDGDDAIMSGDADEDVLRKIRRSATRQRIAYPD